jgi:malate dehydrogenase
MPTPPPCAGVEKVYGMGELNDYEKEALKAMMPELAASIEKGHKFVHDN